MGHKNSSPSPSPTAGAGSRKKQLVISSALILLGALAWFPFWKFTDSPPSPGGVIRKIPIAELAVYDFRFAVLTDAAQTKEGDLIVRIISGGWFGRDETTKVLYRAGVDIRYGVDLRMITPDRYAVNGDTIVLRLPEPSIIGLPRLLREGEDAARVIDRIPAGASITLLEQEIRRRIQEDARHWPKKFGLDGLARERAVHLITAYINAVLPDRRVIIEFDDHMMDKGPGLSAAAIREGG